MSRERERWLFLSYSESFLASPFALGVALPRSGHWPALGMNSAEKLNGCGAVIGSETLSLLL